MLLTRTACDRVLVVDDDPTVAHVVSRYLRNAGFAVEVVADGQLALDTFRADPPDLVVLDLMLPSVDGLEVLRQVREVSAVPVVVLTAKGEQEDRLAGLELGADDYLPKPFSPRELVLRVHAVLRRGDRASLPSSGVVLRDGDLAVDTAAHEARLDGRRIALTAREYDLLVHLLQNPHRAYSRAELLTQVWGWDFGDQATVTVHVRRLREKLERDPMHPRRLVTVFGVGYRYDLQAP